MSKHAYMIIAHNNYYLLSKLISLLDDKRNDLFIHVDKKSIFPDEKEQFLNSIARKSKVLFIDSISVTWGGYSLVDVTINLLKNATGLYHYDYYHLISGCDLPIKTQNSIHDFFINNNGFEFVHLGNKEWIEIVNPRLNYYWLLQEYAGNSRRFDKMCLRIVDRFSVMLQKVIGVNRVNGFNFSAGSEWFSITDEFARYLVSQSDYINHHFHYGMCADECFVQTMAVNSKFGKRIFNPDCGDTSGSTFRFIQWENGKPRVLKMEDYDTLINSGCLFARKFDESNPEIIDKICEMVGRE